MASDLLIEVGLAGVTLEGVAARAGTTTAAVARHFESDLQLVLSLGAHLSDDSKSSVIQGTDPEGTTEERVAQMVEAIIAEVHKPSIRAQFELHTAARVTPELAEQLQRLNAHNAKVYVTDLAVALLEANVEPDRVQAAMEVAVCASVGLSLLTISGGDAEVERRLSQSLQGHLLSEVAGAVGAGA